MRYSINFQCLNLRNRFRINEKQVIRVENGTESKDRNKLEGTFDP